MKKIAFLFSILFVFSCQKKSENKTASFDTLLKEYNTKQLAFNPIKATYTGDAQYNHLFPNFISEGYQQKLNQFYKDTKTNLNRFKDTDLTKDQVLSKAILNWDCDINLAESNFSFGEYMPINQMWTVNLVMGQFASGSSAQPFKTVKDYKNWLGRLDQYNLWLQTALLNMKKGVQKGVVLPKSLIQKIIPQFEELTTKDLNKHLYFTPVKKFPESFSSEDKKELKNEFTAVLNNKLIPSFTAIYNFLKTDYLKAGRTTSGISALPNGKKYYQFAIKKYTTTNMTADEIHALGLKEVARILSEMEKVKTEVGYKGKLKDFFNYVRENKTLMPYKNPKEILDNFNAIHTKMIPKLNILFGNKPKTPFIVKQTEKFRENSSSAEYNQGSLDGTRPGVFYVPIPDATKYNVYSDEALFLHEAIPGHHYQISLTQENQNLPDFRKTLWYSAYGEGWALYTESLGKELGLYTDPYQYFGMLSMEMHRAIRLVVDTGMHAKGWSREKAIQYSLDNEAEPEASIISEIERYMANPGQALAYKIGQLKIRELRAKATKALGSKFDIKNFHNQVLETGCIPLALLETKINLWISNTK